MPSAVLVNPLRSRATWPGSRPEPRAFHRRLPGYAATPLRASDELAGRLGVGSLWVKDESARLGLPAFKVLGASWAIYRTLIERLGHDVGPWRDLDDLAVRLAPLRPLTLVTATDGNHGHAVAHVARLLGFAARIWVPSGTSPARVQAIEHEAATVVRSTGGYDQAVREAAGAADATTLVISDTAWPGYEAIPTWVIEGYSTIFAEIDEQLATRGAGRPARHEPDVVVVPVGVGALAAAVVAHYRSPGRPASTVLVGVEPVGAACVTASLVAGRPVSLPGEQRSIMAGLNCGTPSAVAWPRVSTGLDFMVTITDDQAAAAVRTLAAHGVVAGESGAASLAGLEQVLPELGDATARHAITALLLNTEGATDPASYNRIIASGPPRG
jgi:diaminopropionate ammonia-lyase